MNAYQRDKVNKSITVLTTLLGYLTQVERYAQKRHGNLTEAVTKTVAALATGQVLCVIAPKRDNHTQAEYHAVNFKLLITRMMQELSEELQVMEDDEKAA